MAEIQMERKPRRPVWIWVVAALAVVVIAVGAWLYFANGAAFDTAPAAERPGAAEPAQEQSYRYDEPATRDPLPTPEPTRRTDPAS
jgi:hypothetical protein